jgi:CelD/BcsL family acetyltransferase involved in cellulose biosynthesis
LELVDELGPLRDDWTRLAHASTNIFATWEWNELWWRHYGRDRPLRIGVWRGGDGNVEAIVPAFRWAERPLGILRLLGHGHGDWLGPICAQNDVATARRALAAVLAGDRPDIFVGDWVPGNQDWAGTLRGRRLRETGYPIITLGYDSWDEFTKELSGGFRKKARNYRNRLERNHDVIYRYATAQTLDRDLNEAMRLHEIRFGEHGGCLFCGPHEPFQREFAAMAVERDWLRLLLLEVDGEAVACEYGFFYENAYFSYQGGRDPGWERASVGFVLELKSIRDALEAGAGEYRFLEGDEGYKYRLPITDPRLHTVVAGRTARGRAAAATLAFVRRLPAGRGLVRRFGGR